MKKLQEKLEFLLEKYDVSAKAELISESEAVIDGKKKTLLPWRAERRIIELHNLIAQGRMTGLSTMRITHIAHKKADLYKLLWREADIFEFVTGERIAEIFAVENKGVALNAIAKSANGVVCSFELAATLDKSLPVVDKHEVIAVSGNACDRVVDTQVPQNSIYVFGKDIDTFTDVDAELFGLNIDECAIVRYTFELASKGICNCEAAEHITSVVEAARKSVETVDNIKL